MPDLLIHSGNLESKQPEPNPAKEVFKKKDQLRICMEMANSRPLKKIEFNSR